MGAVIGSFAGPVQPGEGLAILPKGNRCGIQQLRFRSMKKPSQQEAVQNKRTHEQPVLPGSGRAIQLCKQEIRIPRMFFQMLVRRKTPDFVKVLSLASTRENFGVKCTSRLSARCLIP
jgi:hypothetical protein